MYEREYAYTRRIEGQDVPTVADKVRAALPAEGFGVLTEIDVQATLKKKLDVDRKPYLILGACSPKHANQALTVEPPIGVFLPCNIDVFEGDDGATYVQSVQPEKMFGMVGNPDLEPIAAEVGVALRRVLDSL